MAKLDRSWGSTQTDLVLSEQQEASYPQLARMNQDFDFTIIHNHSVPATYWLSTREYLESEALAITPEFSSLDDLESHLSINMVDILYSYLFDISSDDLKDIEQPSHQAIA